MLLPTERFPNTRWRKAGVGGTGQHFVPLRLAKVPHQGRPNGGCRAGHGWQLLKRLLDAEPLTGPALPGASGCRGPAGAAAAGEQPPPAPVSRGAPAAQHLRGSRSRDRLPRPPAQPRAAGGRGRAPRRCAGAQGGPRSAPPRPRGCAGAAAATAPLPRSGREGDRRPGAAAAGGESG